MIVGAGPTGVEMAGALREIARHALAKRLPAHRPDAGAGDPARRDAPGPARSTSSRSRRRRGGSSPAWASRSGRARAVTAIDAEGVCIGPERIAARTVLWAAGVAASPLARSLGVPLDRAGRVQVEPDLTIPGHPEVSVIGDLASLSQDGHPVPGVAPAAIQEARHAARNIVRMIQGQPRLPFHYRDKGSLATIGRAAAVADLGRVKLSGWIAWLAWLFIHIFFLIGFRNRFLVLFQWAWSYVTYDRGARLITGPPPRIEGAGAGDGLTLSCSFIQCPSRDPRGAHAACRRNARG